MLERPQLLAQVRAALRRSPVVALVGPRQSGKTTLARQLVPAGTVNLFDLEDPDDLARLAEPKLALAPLRGLVVIDEVQRQPELFPLLRVLVDRRPRPARFLILGSASPELLRQSSESLAGRLETVASGGFSLAEVGIARQEQHWLRGGFPRAFLARSQADSVSWRKQFIALFLERDLPQLGVGTPSALLHRFWAMLAHYHGRIWSGAELARALAVSEPTVRRYLDLLTGTFMVRQLQPWHANLSKRQVKAPKVYIRDSGLLHQLLGLGTAQALLRHPVCGASWEGYAIEELLRTLVPDEAYFWATHNGAELDLLALVKGRRLGFEVKRTDAPRLTASMRVALADLELDHLYAVYPGAKKYALAPRMTALPLTALYAEPAGRVLLGSRP